MDWNHLIFLYICPSIGVVISTALYTAPVNSLAAALERKSLGALNPMPWGIMTGNCLGWLAYAHYTADPFILASNIPGILVSFWLNAGASKLQYLSASNHEIKSASFTPQDKLLLGVLGFWITVLVSVGWSGLVPPGREKTVVGVIVNINLLFFYGAPLQTIRIVLDEKFSDSIHTTTMILNCVNAGFWGAYGLAINNLVIYIPNGIGFFLGLTQGALCCMYPKRSSASPLAIDVDDEPLLQNNDNRDQTEDPFQAEVDEDELAVSTASEIT